MKLSKFIYLIPLVFLMSCMQDEIPVPVHQSGDVESHTVLMYSDYRYQIYFDLETGQNVAQNYKIEWDLGFECAENGNHVILNSSNNMKAALTSAVDFNEISDTNGNYSWKWDVESGNLDSTAIGEWEAHNFIYIIDGGTDTKGNHRGFNKIKILERGGDYFVLSHCMLSENAATIDTVFINEDLNFMSFSFDDNGVALELEPNKASWDIVFTQYTKYFKEEKVAYLVTGVLNNRYMTWAVEDTIHSFEEINRENVLELEFKERIDLPGYDWKTFLFDENQYVTDSERTYLFRTSDGLFYKLKFTDFVDDQGERGSPTFEYQRL